MLEEFEREVEHTDSRLRSLTSRVNKAIKKSGGESLVVSPLLHFTLGPSQMEFVLVCVTYWTSVLYLNLTMFMLKSGSHHFCSFNRLMSL